MFGVAFSNAWVEGKPLLCACLPHCAHFDPRLPFPAQPFPPRHGRLELVPLRLPRRPAPVPRATREPPGPRPTTGGWVGGDGGGGGRRPPPPHPQGPPARPCLCLMTCFLPCVPTGVAHLPPPMWLLASLPKGRGHPPCLSTPSGFTGSRLVGRLKGV